MTDEAASPTKTYLCSYRFKNQRWSLELKADSEEQAYERLRAIWTSGSVDGELKATVKLGWLERIWTWLTT